jgi:hypothetical protein
LREVIYPVLKLREKKTDFGESWGRKSRLFPKLYAAKYDREKAHVWTRPAQLPYIYVFMLFFTIVRLYLKLKKSIYAYKIKSIPNNKEAKFLTPIFLVRPFILVSISL